MSHDAEKYSEKESMPSYIPSYLEGTEECVVCGDNATGYHYRCITCEGCKGFFRRSVQKNLQKRYCCKKRNACEINKMSRNQCQRCRYTKCIRVGMATELVLNEDKRVAKRRLIENNRKMRLLKEDNVIRTSPDPIAEISPERSRLLIAEIAKAHLESLQAKKVTDSVFLTCSKLPPRERFSTALTKAITGVVDFAKRISLFSNLIQIEDQVKILKYSCMDAIVVRATASYDHIHETLDLFPLVIITREQLCRTRLSSCAEALFRLARDFGLLQFSTVDKAVLEAIVIFKEQLFSSWKQTTFEKLLTRVTDDLQSQNHEISYHPCTSNMIQRGQGYKQILQAFQHHIHETLPKRPNIWPKILGKVNEVRCVSDSLAQAIMTMRNDDGEDLSPFFVRSMSSKTKPCRASSNKTVVELVPSYPMAVAPHQTTHTDISTGIPTVIPLHKSFNESTNRSKKKGALQSNPVLAIEKKNIVEHSKKDENVKKNKTTVCVHNDTSVQLISSPHTFGETALRNKHATKVPSDEQMKNKDSKIPSFLNGIETNRQRNPLKQTSLQRHLTQTTRQQIASNEVDRQSLRYALPSFQCDPVFHFPNPYLLRLPISPTPFGMPRFSSASVLMETSLGLDQKLKPTDRLMDLHKSTKL